MIFQVPLQRSSDLRPMHRPNGHCAPPISPPDPIAPPCAPSPRTVGLLGWLPPSIDRGHDGIAGPFWPSRFGTEDFSASQGSIARSPPVWKEDKVWSSLSDTSVYIQSYDATPLAPALDCTELHRSILHCRRESVTEAIRAYEVSCCKKTCRHEDRECLNVDLGLKCN